MTTSTGTYGVTDLLAARFQSAAEFGLDTIEEVLNEDTANHNFIVQQALRELCEISTDRQRIYGTSGRGQMQEVDEDGKGPTQKNTNGATVAFPLRKFQYPMGWNETWLQIHTPADMAEAVQGAQQADYIEVMRQLKRAAYLSANYTYRDHLVDRIELAVKRFVNADGADIPDGPNGETFDGSTHTHYNASATLTAAALKANIRDVVEHGHGGSVRLVINAANEDAVRNLSGFTAYQDPRLIFGASTTGIPNVRLDIARLDNRAIGIFDSAEVWVKPWAITDYYFVYDAAGVKKPFVFRQRNVAVLQGLRIAGKVSLYPHNVNFMEDEYGIGVWTRTNGAVLYVGDTTYADPTIA
jgi:hypothetical protein